LTDLPTSSRAFIIGDFEKGLTIVITDPVMIAHYTIEELRSGEANLMKGPNTSNLMAALVRELVPILRGVELEELRAQAAGFDAGNTAAAKPAEWRAAFSELDFAETIARIIKAKGSVSTVDFCIGLDVDPSDIAMRWRSASPSKDIIQYLKDNGAAGQTISNRPLVPGIDGIDVDGLDMPPKWQGQPKP